MPVFFLIKKVRVLSLEGLFFFLSFFFPLTALPVVWVTKRKGLNAVRRLKEQIRWCPQDSYGHYKAWCCWAMPFSGFSCTTLAQHLLSVVCNQMHKQGQEARGSDICGKPRDVHLYDSLQQGFNLSTYFGDWLCFYGLLRLLLGFSGDFCLFGWLFFSRHVAHTSTAQSHGSVNGTGCFFVRCISRAISTCVLCVGRTAGVDQQDNWILMSSRLMQLFHPYAACLTAQPCWLARAKLSLAEFRGLKSTCSFASSRVRVFQYTGEDF